MKDIKYVIHQEGSQYVSQCLNVDVASCGDTVEEAIANIIEAVELYFEDNDHPQYTRVDMALIGEKRINA